MEKTVVFKPTSDAHLVLRERSGGFVMGATGSADCWNLAAETANRTFLVAQPSIIPTVLVEKPVAGTE